MQSASTQKVDEIIETVSHVATSSDRHTRFITTMMNFEKVFRISVVVRIDSKEIALKKSHIQADQKSDMNVISLSMTKNLELELLSLNDIEFRSLTMRTANHKKTLLLN